MTPPARLLPALACGLAFALAVVQAASAGPGVPPPLRDAITRVGNQVAARLGEVASPELEAVTIQLDAEGPAGALMRTHLEQACLTAGFKVFDRQSLGEVLAEVDFQQTGLVDPATRLEFATRGVDALIVAKLEVGSYLGGPHLTLTGRVLGVEDGATLGVIDVEVSRPIATPAGLAALGLGGLVLVVGLVGAARRASGGPAAALERDQRARAALSGALSRLEDCLQEAAAAARSKGKDPLTSSFKDAARAAEGLREKVQLATTGTAKATTRSARGPTPGVQGLERAAALVEELTQDVEDLTGRARRLGEEVRAEGDASLDAARDLAGRLASLASRFASREDLVG